MINVYYKDYTEPITTLTMVSGTSMTFQNDGGTVETWLRKISVTTRHEQIYLSKYVCNTNWIIHAHAHGKMAPT